MTFKTYLLIGALTSVFGGVSYAQLRIPTFDVEIKINQNLIPGSGDGDGQIEFVETTNVYAGAHVQINQYVALGGFYSRSFRGTGKIHYDNNNSVNKEVLFLQKGLDIRLSTSRAKKWRKYLVVSYTQIEMVRVDEALRLAAKTNAFGGNLGIMRRLSNNLYLNVIELGLKVMSDDIFWFGTTKDIFIVDAKMGLTYNIGKRK